MQELGEESEERHLGRPALAREGKETGSVGVDWVSLDSRWVHLAGP